MSWTCPHCESENTQALSVLYDSGTSDTTSVGVGVAAGRAVVGAAGSTTTSRLADTVAPPLTKYVEAFLGVLVLGCMLGVGGCFTTQRALEHYYGPDADVSWAFGLPLYVPAAFAVAMLFRIPDTVRDQRTWRRSALCLRCGSRFQVASTSSPAAVVSVTAVLLVVLGVGCMPNYTQRQRAEATAIERGLRPIATRGYFSSGCAPKVESFMATDTPTWVLQINVPCGDDLLRPRPLSVQFYASGGQLVGTWESARDGIALYLDNPTLRRLTQANVDPPGNAFCRFKNGRVVHGSCSPIERPAELRVELDPQKFPLSTAQAIEAAHVQVSAR